MGRPVTDPTLTRAEFKLGEKDLADLDAIAREAARRTKRPASRADAVRWAIRELAARLHMERSATRAGEVVLSGPGPATAPPGGDRP